MNIKKDTILSACPYARRCGGCGIKQSVYAASLRAKQQKLVRLLSRFGRLEKIIGAKEPTGYRNKAQAAFFRRGGETLSGIYQAHDKRVLAVERCLLQKEAADSIINTVRALCPSFKIKPYDIKNGTGHLRHVLVRHAEETGEVMVVLVTGAGELPSARSFTNELVRRHPEITTVVHNINTTATMLFLGEESRVLYGDGYIVDRLCGREFRISPRSFYQVNHAQTEALYTKAAEFAEIKSGERVLDAYCGTGTIGLCIARGADELVGVECNASAVEDARENARRNGASNARFVCGDAGEFMRDAAEADEHFDTVITDPPRAGCSREFLSSLVKLSPNKIVYISCNPETLARDLSYLTKNGYSVKRMVGVDMFPFTEHVETVVLLSREKADDYIRISVHTDDLKAKAN